MRVVSFTALIVGVILIPTALGIAKLEQDRNIAQIQQKLAAETDEHGGALKNYFDRATSNILLTANSPAFARVLAEPGTREARVRRQSRALRDVTRHLGYLEQLYPRSIGEASFVDADGEELARVVRGEIAPAADLSTVEEKQPFFVPTFALKFGQVHQPEPYVSPDTEEWVVANATLVPQRDGQKRAIALFEVTIESFRRAMGAASADSELRVVDGQTGRVIIDGSRPQRAGRGLGEPGDRRFAGLMGVGDEGTIEIAGRRTAYRRIGRSVGNANDWIVVATAKAPVGAFASSMGPAPIIVLALGLIIVALAGISVRASRRELEGHASTDALTGLGNRRKLLADLDRCVRSARAAQPAVLTLFDLNGFKSYNDSYGHPAGDALLLRVGLALAEAVKPFGGQAYRPGGDEFCVIADGSRQHAMEVAASEALSEQGEGFAIGTAFGSVRIPQETGDAAEALRKADQAMYAQKQSGRATADRQSSDVLLRALAERHPDLGDHQNGVAELAEQLGELLGVSGEALSHLRHAAALHDIGKVAIPDAIITKAAPLNEEERAFMRRHTLIGERILAAAPSLGVPAGLVRSSHEAWDGSGYPDGLCDVEIPLGARIIAVCDSFDAMISERPYARRRTDDQALAELRRCAGSQFDPQIVEAFERLLRERAHAPTATAPS